MILSLHAYTKLGRKSLRKLGSPTGATLPQNKQRIFCTNLFRNRNSDLNQSMRWKVFHIKQDPGYKKGRIRWCKLQNLWKHLLIFSVPYLQLLLRLDRASFPAGQRQTKQKWNLILDLSIPSTSTKFCESVIKWFHSAVFFLYTLKDIFRGYRKRPVT